MPHSGAASLHFRSDASDGWIGLKREKYEGPERTLKELDLRTTERPVANGECTLLGGRFCRRPSAARLLAACYDLGLVATSFSDSAESFDAL